MVLFINSPRTVVFPIQTDEDSDKYVFFGGTKNQNRLKSYPFLILSTHAKMDHNGSGKEREYHIYDFY